MAIRWVTAIVCATALIAPRPARALFDDIPPSPRARALGQAMIANGGDAWSLHYNPALLPALAHAQASVATVDPSGLGFHRMTTLAIATPLPGKRGALAIGWRRYGVENGDVSLATENTISVAHGFTLFRDASTSASVGWGLDLYNAEFASSIGAAGDGTNGVNPGNAWSAGVNLGAVVNVYERTRVGFFTRNLNSATIGDDKEELQRSVGVGLAYEPYIGVRTAFDIRSILGQDFRICGGLEFEVLEGLDLRAGIETEPNRVTGGFGVHVPLVTLDYGFSTGGGVLDGSHHFGVSLRWDRAPRAQ
jgi:hypothetical protein